LRRAREIVATLIERSAQKAKKIGSYR
jgi:hypothetical protein